jgi:glutathione S-transferase
VQRLARSRLADALALAEKRLDAREWFFETFGVVDAYFFWCLRRASQLGIELGAYQNCSAHFERVGRRPSTKKVLDRYRP